MLALKLSALLMGLTIILLYISHCIVKNGLKGYKKPIKAKDIPYYVIGQNQITKVRKSA